MNGFKKISKILYIVSVIIIKQKLFYWEICLIEFLTNYKLCLKKTPLGKAFFFERSAFYD